MKRLLLTGASGFVGRHVMACANTGEYEIHIVSRRERGAVLPPDTSWHSADLFDRAELERVISAVRPTHLLHLAWEATPGIYVHAPSNYEWVEASKTLVRLFHRYGGRRAVGVGSCAEYEWLERELTETESPLSHRTPYAACKNGLREWLETFAEETGLSCAWGRLFFLYGPFEHPSRLVASVMQAVLRGEPANCTEGTQKRDFLFAADAARALLYLLESDQTGTFNIASGSAPEVREIVEEVGRLSGRSHLIRLGAIEAPAQPPLVVGHIGRLRALGWRPEHDLRSGLLQTMDWWSKTMANACRNEE
ncbi:NAD-dependent epimerase/dehydratase [Paenibacillus sp. MWE-103]|uniref:NAD-dependent epimerase/dehydratase n=1 Tax=Paenibacillus artemisiicola TaxID=1172618 RepID=A0ABS3WFZ2_9BACL|nr:NAD(P)-dependent oxidoreductase [Paenibacillus artemisiicola]MBO7747246.1 NAD-dependent epimerase/dehydratase [Paenibacillus artemisiicola]